MREASTEALPTLTVQEFTNLGYAFASEVSERLKAIGQLDDSPELPQIQASLTRAFYSYAFPRYFVVPAQQDEHAHAGDNDR